MTTVVGGLGAALLKCGELAAQTAKEFGGNQSL
jgi:hypothetical protein